MDNIRDCSIFTGELGPVRFNFSVWKFYIQSWQKTNKNYYTIIAEVEQSSSAMIILANKSMCPIAFCTGANPQWILTSPLWHVFIVLIFICFLISADNYEHGRCGPAPPSQGGCTVERTGDSELLFFTWSGPKDCTYLTICISLILFSVQLLQSVHRSPYR